jgi:hypothetical protein
MWLLAIVLLIIAGIFFGQHWLIGLALWLGAAIIVLPILFVAIVAIVWFLANRN